MGFSLKHKSPGTYGLCEGIGISNPSFSPHPTISCNRSSSTEQLSPEELLDYIPEFDVDSLSGASSYVDEARTYQDSRSSRSSQDIAWKELRLPEYPEYAHILLSGHQEWNGKRYDFADDIVENSRGNMREYDLLGRAPQVAPRRAGGEIGSTRIASQRTWEYRILPHAFDIIFDVDDILNVDVKEEAPAIELSAIAVAEQFQRLTHVKDLKLAPTLSSSPKTDMNKSGLMRALAKSRSYGDSKIQGVSYL